MNEVLAKVTAQIEEDAAVTARAGKNRAFALLEAYNRLQAEGIELPKLEAYHLRWGFVVNVTEPSQWKGIHKAVGRLVVQEKEPVTKNGKPTREIRLTLSPPSSLLAWYVKVQVVRKLKKSDPCRVRVVTTKSVQVVCEVPKPKG
jgi:hypothetical protein